MLKLGHCQENLQTPMKKIRLFILIATSIVLMLFGEIACSQGLETEQADEIQVLIDVSGSMRQNDPDNQRIAASKLLISLVPEKAKVSIWLFAEKTTELIRSNAVDAAWRQQALQATAKINSRGLYTNIEDGIQTVLQAGFAGKGAKHLILLTDGMVDISKDIMVSADSRERILSEWIPKLQMLNIHALTIALSGQADRELLEKLAFDTGGWHEAAANAEQLQRVFLKMVLKAAPKDSLPLTGNQFKVDNNVKEFSLLAFKKSGSAPSRLFTPQQNKIDKQTISAKVAWLETSANDLITVSQPEFGDWRLEADIDPDNQLMIMTDLKMQAAELPNYVGEKEHLSLKVHFTDQDKIISRADFLEMIKLTLSIDSHEPLLISTDTTEPGFFTYTVPELSVGKHQLKILADGTTFKREITQEIEVIAQPILVEKLPDQSTREMTLKLIPDLAVIDADSLVIEAEVSYAGKPPESHRIEADDNTWTLKLPALEPDAEAGINFHVIAKSVDGHLLSPVIKPIRINAADFQPAEQAQEHAELTAEADESVENEPSAQSVTAEPEETNWLVVSGIVLVVNVVLGVGGYFIFLMIRKSHAEKQQKILERLS